MNFSRPIFFLLFIFSSVNLFSQKLDFIGLKGVYFGMSKSEMTDKTVILDSSSAYKDTATYLRNTRCQNYFRKTQDLQLTGFKASGVEYEFCDGELSYVFIHVSGETEIMNALKTLKLTFKNLGCKGKAIEQCTQMDSSAKGMRLIVNVDHKKQIMDLVLIPKQAAK